MSEDFISSIEQRKAEMRDVAGLFASFRGDLISQGFSTERAEEIAVMYSAMFLGSAFDEDELE